MGVVVALLRGVNLGTRQVRSADLRAVAVAVGCRDAVTHLASGNLVAVADGRPDQVAAALSAALTARHGFTVPVVARDLAAWDDAVAGLPFVSQAHDEPARVALMCFDGPIGDVAGFDATRYGREQVVWREQDAYLWYPDGQARTRLTSAVLDRASGRLGTARSWTTVLALARLAHDRAG